MIIKDRAKIENVTSEFLSLIKLPDKSGKKLNYLIVMPSQPHSNDEGYLFPLGLPYISAVLKSSGRNVYTLNLSYKEQPDKLIKEIVLNADIDVIMTGGLYLLYKEIKKIVDTAKRVKPEITTVVGGGYYYWRPCNSYGSVGER